MCALQNKFSCRTGELVCAVGLFEVVDGKVVAKPYPMECGGVDSERDSHSIHFSLKDNTCMQPSVSRSVQRKSPALIHTLVDPGQSIRDELIGKGRGAWVLKLIN